MKVFREINRAHSAFAKFFENSIMGDCLANHRGSRNVKLRSLCANGYSNSRQSGGQKGSYSTVSRIFFSCAARKSCSFCRSSGRLLARIATAKSAAFVAPGLPIASVPTGIPPGICTVAKSESSPLRASLFIGTPRTGSVVWAARTPARCAAPPAAAITTSSPRDSAVDPNSAARDGDRCAEITRHSCSTPNCVRVSSAWRIVSQSDWLPIMTATSGLFPFSSGILFSLVQRETTLAVECVETFSLDEIETRVSHATEQRHHLRMHDFSAVRLSQETTAPVV